MIPKPKYMQFKFPNITDVACAFGTRHGGSGKGQFAENNISFEVGDLRKNVLENRKSVRDEFGFGRLVELKQVHGDIVHFDLQDDFIEGSGLEGDGICVSEPGTALMIKTADCQPVFLAHESGRYACALHVGWRGSRMDFPGRALKLFCAHYSISPDEIMAVRGPSLGPCCAEFIDFGEHWSQEFEDYYNLEDRTMDLWRLTRDQLVRAGVRETNVFGLDLCTKCNESLFFSYRREKTCGRMGNFMLLKS